jgi:alpha-methylacyl-CoA racemase
MTVPRPLSGVRVANLGINVPPGAAAWRLGRLGASGTKVEPPDGDPVEAVSPELYRLLTHGQDVVRLDLKNRSGRAALDELLGSCDILITASRPAALERLGLSRTELARFPRLVHVSIVGEPAPRQHLAGHDLTYVARRGLVEPPSLPRTLVADLGGAEQAASTAVALLYARDRGGSERYAEVALEETAAFFALPIEHGLTQAGGLLGGGYPFYGLYEANGGWIALAALEPHFRERLLRALGLESADAAALAKAFRSRSPQEWEVWAEEHDVPLAAVRNS